MPMFLKLSKIEEEGTLPNSFYKRSTTYLPNYKKRKLQTNIPDQHRCQTPQQYTSKRIQQHIKRSIAHDQVRFN